MVDVMLGVTFVDLVNHLRLASLDKNLIIEMPCFPIPSHIGDVCSALVDLRQTKVCHNAGVVPLLFVGVTHNHHFFVFVNKVPDVIPVPVSVSRKLIIPLE